MTDTLPRFEVLIADHHDEIFRYLWRLLDSGGLVDQAEDLAQEVFMRAYRAYDRLRPNSNVRAWLYKIATNCAYSALKRGQRDPLPLIDDAPDGRLQPHQQVSYNETLAEVQAAIETLPQKQRAALIMRYLQELDYAEIADALNCSEDSARANVYQALRRLRCDLANEITA
jgi:RNA polymerase sigma-70 factor (ECF subfamily)